MTSDLDCARSIIADATRVVSLTGAGISAESGVPTFRGPVDCGSRSVLKNSLLRMHFVVTRRPYGSGTRGGEV